MSHFIMGVCFFEEEGECPAPLWVFFVGRRENIPAHFGFSRRTSHIHQVLITNALMTTTLQETNCSAEAHSTLLQSIGKKVYCGDHQSTTHFICPLSSDRVCKEDGNKATLVQGSITEYQLPLTPCQGTISSTSLAICISTTKNHMMKQFTCG